MTKVSKVFLDEPVLKKLSPLRDQPPDEPKLDGTDNDLSKFIESAKQFVRQDPKDDKRTLIQVFNASSLNSNTNNFYISKVEAYKYINCEIDKILLSLPLAKNMTSFKNMLEQLNTRCVYSNSSKLNKESIEIKSMIYALLSTSDFNDYLNIQKRLISKADNMLGSPDYILQFIGLIIALLLIIIASSICLTTASIGSCLVLSCMAGIIGGYIAYLGGRQGSSLALLNLITSARSNFEDVDILNSLSRGYNWQPLEKDNSYKMVFANQAELDNFLDKHDFSNLIQNQSNIQMKKQEEDRTSQVSLYLSNASQVNLTKLHYLQQTMQANDEPATIATSIVLHSH